MGIGTTIPVGALTVMNDNVGIGTWVTADAVDIHVANAKNGLRITDNGSGDGIQFQGNYPSVNFNAFWDGSNERAIGPDYTGAISLDPDGGMYLTQAGKRRGRRDNVVRGQNDIDQCR